ncbi:MAG: YigZ family protein, partial [Rhizobiaceae bacterium]
ALPISLVGGEGKSLVERRKSKFFGWVVPMSGREAIEAALSTCRIAHPEARHHPWAARWVEDGQLHELSRDDGEPSGTAGVPALDALRVRSLENALVVVSRQFGGVLLGAGGLVRAYRAAADAAIEAATYGPARTGWLVELWAAYAVSGAFLARLEREGFCIERRWASEDGLAVAGWLPGEALPCLEQAEAMYGPAVRTDRCEPTFRPPA